jgi:hypothetical protein
LSLEDTTSLFGVLRSWSKSSSSLPSTIDALDPKPSSEKSGCAFTSLTAETLMLSGNTQLKNEPGHWLAGQTLADISCKMIAVLDYEMISVAMVILGEILYAGADLRRGHIGCTDAD